MADELSPGGYWRRVVPDEPTTESIVRLADVLAAIPDNWLDSLLTGSKAAIGRYPYDGDDIERLLRAVRARVAALPPVPQPPPEAVERCAVCGETFDSDTGAPFLTRDGTMVCAKASCATHDHNSALPAAVEQAREAEKAELAYLRRAYSEMCDKLQACAQKYVKDGYGHDVADLVIAELAALKSEQEAVEGSVECGDFLTGEMRERLERAKRVRAVVVPDDWPVSATVTVTRRVARPEEGKG